MRLISRKSQKIGKTTADGLLQFNTIPEQQLRFRQSHVAIIADLIRDGVFRYAEIGIAVLDGREVLVNGQHTLSAISQLNTAVDAVIERYEVDDDEDLSLLFRQYDPSWNVRTLAQLSAFEVHALDIDWPRKTTQLLIAALSLNDDEMAKASTSKKIEAIKTNIDSGKFIHAVVNGCRFMERASVCAAVLRCREKSQRDASAFWLRVREGDGLTHRDPEKHLREFLMSASINYGRGACNSKRTTNHEVLYRCAGAWNARRRDESRAIIKYFPNKPIPRFI